MRRWIWPGCLALAKCLASFPQVVSIAKYAGALFWRLWGVVWYNAFTQQQSLVAEGKEVASLWQVTCHVFGIYLAQSTCLS